MARDLAVDHISTILVMAMSLIIHSIPVTFSAQAALGEPVQTLTLQRGNISALLRDNALSPGLLSGVDSLFNRVDAPNFDAFDPDDRGASAGLNFEHVICGQSNSFNAFSPRRGRYELFKLSDDHSAKPKMIPGRCHPPSNIRSASPARLISSLNVARTRKSYSGSMVMRFCFSPIT